MRSNYWSWSGGQLITSDSQERQKKYEVTRSEELAEGSGFDELNAVCWGQFDLIGISKQQ